ncbi:hypothetical protein B566_EDAN004317, partial [Ephemera danica]
MDEFERKLVSACALSCGLIVIMVCSLGVYENSQEYSQYDKHAMHKRDTGSTKSWTREVPFALPSVQASMLAAALPSSPQPIEFPSYDDYYDDDSNDTVAGTNPNSDTMSGDQQTTDDVFYAGETLAPPPNIPGNNNNNNRNNNRKRRRRRRRRKNRFVQANRLVLQNKKTTHFVLFPRELYFRPPDPPYVGQAITAGQQQASAQIKVKVPNKVKNLLIVVRRKGGGGGGGG